MQKQSKQFDRAGVSETISILSKFVYHIFSDLIANLRKTTQIKHDLVHFDMVMPLVAESLLASN